MSVDLKKISTEGRNPSTMDIDRIPTLGILQEINHEDQGVALAVEKALPQVAKAVDKIVECFEKGGRLVYMGAGTSGRIGILDAVECPPTYGVDFRMVQCLMAGGSGAMVKAVEGAEDSKEMAIADLKSIDINTNDFVCGIAASGRTPYVVGGVEYAKSLGIATGCITTSASSILASVVDFPMEAVTGPEAITGSTRMKSGTAQKLICNMLSTASMVKMGKVYENLMIDLQATNEKLVSRSCGIVSTLFNTTASESAALIKKYGSIKKVILNHYTKMESVEEMDKLLEKVNGNIRKAIEIASEK
jgi:N-acetylmuramic acid 6-phosphate etherase